MDFGRGGDDDDDDGTDEEELGTTQKMKCLSCKDEYGSRDAGTCRECYEEASETEEELKREIEDLKSKVNFLRIFCGSQLLSPAPFTDVVLVASDDRSTASQPVPIPAHRAVLGTLEYSRTDCPNCEICGLNKSSTSRATVGSNWEL